MAAPLKISPHDLYNSIGIETNQIVVDVRIDEDVLADPTFIPGSIQCPAQDIARLVDQFPGCSFVIYCHKGFKLSQGAAAILRHHGRPASYLIGGHVGWRQSDLPTVESDPSSHHRNADGAYWVLGHRPDMSTLVSCWFIRRFIDPQAAFLFVDKDQIELVADRFAAHPMPSQNAYATLLENSGIDDIKLENFGRNFQSGDSAITNAGETGFSLHNLFTGIGRLCDDDLSSLKQCLPLFDALYASTADCPSTTEIRGAD